MPCVIRCSACQFKFFNDLEDVTSPADIMRRYGLRCPSCLRKLDFNPRKITIVPAQHRFNGRRNLVSRRIILRTTNI